MKAYSLPGPHHQQDLATLTAQIAHDMRSPLTAIRVLMLKQPFSPQEGKLLKASLKRFENLLHSLTTPYKKSNGQDLPKKSLDAESLRPACAEITEEVRLLSQSHKKDIRFIVSDFSLAHGFFKIHGCLYDFKRVLCNLVTNAYEALPTQGGKVQVCIYIRNKNVIIKCRDNGCGIPEHLIGQIFRPGFSWNKPHGNGIGLSGCLWICEENEWQLTASSQEGKGSCFTLKMPLLV